MSGNDRMHLYYHKSKYVLYTTTNRARPNSTLKCLVSCHSLLLLGNRKSTTHLTLQQKQKISFCGHFFEFWANGPKYRNQLQASRTKKGVEISGLFLSKFYKNVAFQNGLEYGI